MEYEGQFFYIFVEYDSLVFTLHDAGLFILLLALPRPVRCNIDAVVFFLISLFFRLVHRGWLVLGRAVDGVKDERCWTGVDELMLCTGWNDDEIARLNVLVFACDGGFAGAGCKCQDLIYGMFLEKDN